MARTLGASVGSEVRLARANHALSLRSAAALAGVSAQTQRRVEDGDPSVAIDTLCRVAAALGLKVWGRAFPQTAPTLRDTGQLRVAEMLRSAAHPSASVALEYPVGDLRAADLVVFSADEVLDFEIERSLVDFQAQYRVADEKRQLLRDRHERPVRLVLVVEDSRRNRSAVSRHRMIADALPAGTREIHAALRAGRRLGRDGLMWVRPYRPIGLSPASR